MKVTAKIKLLPSKAQLTVLKHTLETCNMACDYISQVAWDNRIFSQFKLHKLVYYHVREKFGLSAQATVRCIAKVADAYKLDQKTQRRFTPHGGIAYDGRLLRYQLTDNSVSIWMLNGRLKVDYVAGEVQHEQLKTQQSESDLLYQNGRFYLGATCEVKEAKPIEVQAALGVDLGIKNIAATSDGQRFAGNHLNNVRRRRRRQRKKIQKVGTKSARRKLKKLSGKERRFATHQNHVISKQIVQQAKRTNQAIALEQLKGIRQRARARKPQRDDLHSWAFHQLGQFVQYKAQREGVPLVFVDPAYTSQECSECGYVHKRNRKTQEIFQCLHCGHADNADIDAARVIARRGIVNGPIVSDASFVYACDVAPGTSPPLLVEGS